MRIEIYHLQPAEDGRAPTEGFSFPADYKRVATVECHPSEVFQVTNNSTKAGWTRNPQVVDLPEGDRLRSTG